MGGGDTEHKKIRKTATAQQACSHWVSDKKYKEEESQGKSSGA